MAGCQEVLWDGQMLMADITFTFINIGDEKVQKKGEHEQLNEISTNPAHMLTLWMRNVCGLWKS